MVDFKMPDDNVVGLSESAIKHFENIANGKIVKFGIEGGSCAGHKYSWNIYDTQDSLYPDDVIIEHDNFTFAVDGASLLFVIGSQIDYLSGITGNHIEVHNPNAVASCGCGESVSFG